MMARAVVVVVANDLGKKLELVVPYVFYEQVITALGEASSKAATQRQALGKTTGQQLGISDTPIVTAISCQFGVADDRSAMLLLVNTQKGQVRIAFPRAMATELLSAVQRNAQQLAAPPKNKAH
jgi:hypothetical protein